MVYFEVSTQIINCVYLGIPRCHTKTIDILHDKSDGVHWFLAGGIAILFCFWLWRLSPVKWLYSLLVQAVRQ
jgi:hypothetical protein